MQLHAIILLKLGPSQFVYYRDLHRVGDKKTIWLDEDEKPDINAQKTISLRSWCWSVGTGWTWFQRQYLISYAYLRKMLVEFSRFWSFEAIVLQYKQVSSLRSISIHLYPFKSHQWCSCIIMELNILLRIMYHRDWYTWMISYVFNLF